MTPLHTIPAEALDAADPLARFRDQFLIPRHGEGEQAYFCGNSLGLQPRGVREALLAELDDWAELGVEAHFRGRHPWMPYHSELRDGLAHIAGAHPSEVVAMNSLTVNLHLLMASFYRPTAERPAILIEAGAFPSDQYAVASQVRFHGFDPARDVIEVQPDEPNGTLSMAAIDRVLGEHGHRIALVLWPGVQYRTGQ
ncbi:MAG: kynureninase, partial [Arenimonas caeni]|nr:kynureninase [Arenimonas caeni]